MSISKAARSVIVLGMAFLVSPLFATGVPEAGTEVVNVYSHRHYDTDRALFEAFTEETGIEVRVVEAGADELIQRLRAEGEQTEADVLITVDAARLNRAKSMDLLQSVSSESLEERIPSHLRERDGHWYALTKRARVIAYHNERSDRSILSTYEALAESDFDDAIAIRSSGNVYNQSLLASIIAHNGAETARQWAAGVVDNMARDPQGGDRDQLKAIAAGEADYAVVNTYYIGQMLNSTDPQEQQVGEQIGVFFPNQEGRGAHVNVSGAGVTRHAKNRDNAVRLIEFLVSDRAQERFAKANYEYPVVDDVDLAPSVAAWGEFKEDSLDLSRLGEHNDEAVRIFDEVGWQ
ncbi:MAG: Fe(3+) ABC transporter substrate-binding protein [Alkalispirochaetaceae bacterium]